MPDRSVPPRIVPPRIVIVEDEPLTRELFLRTLGSAGFDAIGAGDAVACRAILREAPTDLVMLDLGLPGVGGLTLARELRDAGDVGLMVVSREHTPEMRVAALEIGCDDYMVKPVHLGELCARVQAVLRRRAPRRRAWIGPVLIDVNARTVEAAGQPVALTRGEFTVLVVLLKADGGVVPREQIAAQVSRTPEDSDPRTIDALVRRIRRKLEPVVTDEIVATVPGIGYRLAVPIGNA